MFSPKALGKASKAFLVCQKFHIILEIKVEISQQRMSQRSTPPWSSEDSLKMLHDSKLRKVKSGGSVHQVMVEALTAGKITSEQ